MSEWISVDDEMPKNGKKVIATYKNGLGNSRQIIAFIVGKFEEETGCDNEWFDEHPDTGKYFLPMGWYEAIDNWGEYSSVFVNEGDITHWAQLREPPK